MSSPIARRTDMVLIHNVSEDDCPSEIHGIIFEGSPDAIAGGLGIAVLNGACQLECPECNQAILVEGSHSVLTNGLPTHRAQVDQVLASCGHGITIQGEPSVLAGD